MPTVRFASTNAIKLEEARAILPEIEEVRLSLPELQTVDPEVVVRHKLDAVRALDLPRPVLVEDTGLAVEAWAGLPGALVKWFVEELGPREFARIIRAGTAQPRALATSVVGLIAADDTVHVWRGQTSGSIVTPRGELGGWTSIFEVDGHGNTLAEMTFTDRMTVTMRRTPLEEARTWLHREGCR